MIVTLQTRSTLTIPREMRERLGISPGDPLEAEVEEGRLVLTPVAVVPRKLFLSETGKVKEAQADKDVERGRTRVFESTRDLLDDLET